jgi:lipopolysaccharide/colanic/teichoic acid biosynthesis glycosyltransferase
MTLINTSIRPHLVIISKNATHDFKAHSDLIFAHIHGIPIIDCENLLFNYSNRVKLTHVNLWSYLMTATRQNGLLSVYTKAKYTLEPLIAAVMLIGFAPLFVITAIAMKISDSGPIFYSQIRTGHHGKRFKVHKFRTMKTDAEKRGPQWASAKDDRITRLGRWLRDLHIDEIPQLWNVIRGEMSFVGPRPERPEFYEKLSLEIPLFSVRTMVRPGITGWAQVCSGYAASIEESERKLEFDLYYIQHLSPVFDLLIVLKTFFGPGPILIPREGTH